MIENEDNEPAFAPVASPQSTPPAERKPQKIASETTDDETRAPEEEGMSGNPSDPSEPPVEQPPTKEQY